MAEDQAIQRMQIAKLERRCRVTCCLALASLVVTLGASLTRTAASAPKTTVLRGPVTIVDRRGRTVVRISGDGITLYGGGLSLVGPKGKDVLRLGTNYQGGQLLISDNTGEPLACLGAAWLAGAVLAFYGKPGTRVLALGGDPYGAGLTMSNAAIQRGLRLESGENGGRLAIYGKDGLEVFARP